MQDILPWDHTSPDAIKSFLNDEHTKVSVMKIC